MTFQNGLCFFSAVFQASGVFVEQLVTGSKNRPLLLPVVAKEKTGKKKRMETVNKRKKKSGRPAKGVKKEVRAAIRFSKAEHFIIREKATQAGVNFSTYLRQTALQATIKARLTDEERHFVRQLIGMAGNLNQLAKTCHREGALKAMLYFENYRSQLDELLKKLHHG